MEVYVCGHNSFNHLNPITLKLSEHSVSVNYYYDDVGDKDLSACGDPSATARKGKQQSHVQNPLIIFSTNQCMLEYLNIRFTWSRYWASFKTENGKCVTLVSGFDGEKCSLLVFENKLCAAVTEKMVLLKEEDTPQNLSALCDGQSYPISVSVMSDGQQTSCVKLNHIAGGHLDFHTVYDGVSFGKFERLSSENAVKMSLKIGHIDSVVAIKEMSCGKEHVLLLSKAGNVYSYGLSSRGQLGHGEIENETSPRLIDALDGLAVKTIAAGGWHSTAVSEIGDLYVWGWNESGQLGLGSTKSGSDVTTKACSDETAGIVGMPECVDIPDGNNVKVVACGSRHTIILTEPGRIFTCGWNGYGQLGTGDTWNRSALTLVAGLTRCSNVFAGQWNSAFVCPKM